jgi:hypothetical protein
MGIFNPAGLQELQSKMAARLVQKKAAIDAVKSNPNATRADYVQAGVNPFIAGSMMAKAKIANMQTIRNTQMQPTESISSPMGTNPVSPVFAQDLNAQPPIQTFDPGIKPSGAPVNFNPAEQATMNGMFGTPMNGSFDRAIPAQQQPVIAGQINPTIDNQQIY